MLKSSSNKKVIFVSDSSHLNRVSWTTKHLFQKSSHQFWYTSPDQLAWSKGLTMNPKLWRDILYEFPATHYYRLFHGVLSIDNDPEQLQSLKKLYAQLLRKVIWQNEADFYGKTADGKQEYSPSEFVSRQFREEASF